MRKSLLWFAQLYERTQKEKQAMVKITIGPSDALVVIDAENDFGHPNGALYAKGFPGEASNDEVKSNILRLLSKQFGLTVATRDVHPDSGHVEFGLYGRHVVAGTWGADYLDELGAALSRVGFTLIKGLDPALVSLSIIVSPMFGDLVKRLRFLGIKRVFVCGWAYTHCVGLSAIALANQGFEVVVVRDATRSVSAEFGGDPERMEQQLAFDRVEEVIMDAIDWHKDDSAELAVLQAGHYNGIVDFILPDEAVHVQVEEPKFAMLISTNQYPALRGLTVGDEVGFEVNMTGGVCGVDPPVHNT